MRSGIIVDDSLWPLLVSRLSGAVSDAQYDEYLRRCTAYLQRGELYVSVLDMGRLQLPTAEQRRRQTEWMKASRQLLREQMLGGAFVLTSPVLRLGLSALYYLVPPPAPYVVVPDWDSGVRWVLQRLAVGGRAEDARRIRERLDLSGE